MGGEMRWEALEYIVAVLEVDDIERLVDGLVQIRDYLSRNRHA